MVQLYNRPIMGEVLLDTVLFNAKVIEEVKIRGSPICVIFMLARTMDLIKC